MLHRRAEYEMLLPTGWPGLIRVFSKDFEKLKLAELLAFCGDRGKYLVGLTDVDPVLKALFIQLLDLMGKFIRVTRTKKQNAVVHKELVEVLAALEAVLPMYWCTITKHILLHMSELMGRFGSFWAWNMLPVERFHVLIKRLARSSKSILASIDVHYDLYLNCQHKFHYSKPGLWDHKNRKTLSSAPPLKQPSGEIKYDPAKCKSITVSDTVYDAFLNDWGVCNKTFKALRGRYKT